MSEPSTLWTKQREPIILIALTMMAGIFFTLVLFLSRSYERHQDSVARRLYARGTEATQLGQFAAAAQYYRAALNYSRDNYLYELSLARALHSLGHRDEANAYLLSLWERQPDDGTVNLELARVYADQGSVDQALRYYHNAMYASWSSDPDSHRRQARLELIEFLLNHQATAQAESEIIAMTSGLPDDPSWHLRAADLLMRVQDFQRALKQYEYVLRANRKDPLASAGAGRAAFKLALYRTALRHLQNAVALRPQDTESVRLLQTAQAVIRLDPFARGLSDKERNRRVLESFQQAGERLKTCPSQAPAPGAAGAVAESSPLAASWSQLKSKVTAAGLRRDPELRDQALDVVFDIEQQTENKCAPPSDKDLALLLISQERERTER